MTAYDTLCEHVRLNGPVMSLNRACQIGEIPISYQHAKRLVKLAVIRKDLRIHRREDLQGRPFVLESAHA